MALCLCGCGLPVKKRWRQGHNPKIKGRHFTAEHRAKLSAARKGKRAGEAHQNWGRHLSPDTRRKIGEALRGQVRVPDAQAHPATIHEWLRKNYPWAGVCSQCGKPRPQRRNHDLANINGHVYTRNPDDYREMCRACHLAFDYASGRRTGRKSS